MNSSLVISEDWFGSLSEESVIEIGGTNDVVIMGWTKTSVLNEVSVMLQIFCCVGHECGQADDSRH